MSAATPVTPKISLIGAGQGRHGSLWLKTALANNSACPNASITHEQFRAKPWITFMQWKHTTNPVIIDTNVSLEVLITLIETFDAQVGVVLRNPVAWIQSLITRRSVVGRLDYAKTDAASWLQVVRHVAVATVCRTETMLAIMEQTNRPLRCWRLDYCVTEPGLREIAAWAGLPLRKDFQLPGKIRKHPQGFLFFLRQSGI